MGETMAHPRAFIKASIRPDNLDPELARALKIIRQGFAEASTPVPRRAPPTHPTDDKFKPPVKVLRAGQVLKPRKDPENLNKNNLGRILRIYSFDDPHIFPGRQIFVEVNQKKMTRPKFWAAVRQQLDALAAPVYLRVDHARGVGGAVRNRSPFYRHVLSRGRLLYADRSNIWAYGPIPETITKAARAQRQQDAFQAEIAAFSLKQRQFFRQKNYRRAGAQLRNSIEAAYHMLLTLLHGHSYPETDIAFLRARAEALAPDLCQPWFHGTERYEAEFERLRHAHKDTHRFWQYKMSEAGIKRLSLCQKRLLKMADRLCQPRYWSTHLNILNLAKNAYSLFQDQPPQAQSMMLNLLYSNCSWKHGKLSAEFRQPFDLLAETVANDMQNKKAGIRDSDRFENWLPEQDSNLRQID